MAASNRKKLAPRILETRSAESAPYALVSTGTRVSVFGAGALLLALSTNGCSREVSPVTSESAQTASVSVAAASNLELAEAPVRIVAPEAPPNGKVAPAPTTVVIRPGHPMRTAGRMPAPRGRDL
jgi:hypothetical protein